MATATIGGIPVYNATIVDEECGMIRISLVDDPAVMSNFLAFKDEKKVMNYAIQDEEKRLVLGVVMRADFPIYRRDEKNGEYYVMYTPEVIRQMAEKYLKENKQNDVNTMHMDNSSVEDVNMVQWFIKDTSKGINPDNLLAEDGSLIAEFHVTNDEVWEDIKNGTYKGFSLEGIFGMIPNEDSAKVEEIVNSLDGKFSNTKKNMTKISRIKAALLKALVETEFASVTTDKGVLVRDGEGEFKVGDSVNLQDAEDNETIAPDGEYTTNDNKVIVVTDGKVTEIKDAEPTEPTPTDETPVETPTDEETPKDEPTETPETEEQKPEETTEETPDNTDSLKEENDSLKAEVESLKSENESLKAEVASLTEQIDSLKAEVEKMQKMSGAKPAHDEVKTTTEMQRTGVKGKDRISYLMSL